MVSKLSEIWSGLFIRILILPIPDPGVKKAPDPDPQHCSLPHVCERQNATLPVGGCDPMLSHPPAPSTLSQHHHLHHNHQLLPTVLGSPRVSLALLPLEECVCLCAFFRARLVWKLVERRRGCFFSFCQKLFVTAVASEFRIASE